MIPIARILEAVIEEHAAHLRVREHLLRPLLEREGSASRIGRARSLRIAPYTTIVEEHSSVTETPTYLAWRTKVVEFLPQFAAYAAALRLLEGREVVAGWVHLPAGGGLVEIRA